MQISRNGWLFTAVCFGVCGALARPAQAEPSHAAAKNAATADDVVETTDGGVFRGQISEKVPNSHVIVITLTGDVRRFDWARVKFAGTAAAWAERAASAQPAGDAASEASPGAATNTSAGGGQADAAGASKPDANAKAVQSEKQHAQVAAKRDAHLIFNSPGGHTLYLRKVATGSFGPTTDFEELCTAPCEVDVASGNHVLAVARPLASAPFSAGPLMIPPGTSHVSASVSDMRGTRVFGAVLLIAAPTIGFLMATVGLVHTENDCSVGYCSLRFAPDTGLILGGAAVALAGGGAGLALVLQRDSAEIEVRRQARSGAGAAVAAARSPWSLPGVAVRGTF